MAKCGDLMEEHNFVQRASLQPPPPPRVYQDVQNGQNDEINQKVTEGESSQLYTESSPALVRSKCTESEKR